jgi:prevent-host-death family protein
VLSTNQKGAIAELKVAAEASAAGVHVLRPMQEHGRYDLAFEIGGRLLRVQVKSGALIRDGSVVAVNLQGSRCTPDGYVRSWYSADEIDLLAVYCGQLDRCYLLPRELAVGRRTAWLRVRPALNGQRACLNIAAEYEFRGAVAQLEERLTGSQEVRGSNPLSSTVPVPGAVSVGCHEFRNRFGHYLEQAAAGTSIEISRRGRPYARLVPAAPVDMCPEMAADSKGGPGVADRPLEVA